LRSAVAERPRPTVDWSPRRGILQTGKEHGQGRIASHGRGEEIDFTGVADAIAVRIQLIGVAHLDAVVTGITDTIGRRSPAEVGLAMEGSCPISTCVLRVSGSP